MTVVAHFLIAFGIYLFAIFPAILASIPVVAILLLTKWDGRTTIFGNSKWGRGNDHFAHATKGYWQEFVWLVLRNPVNNLHSHKFAARMSFPRIPYGNPHIGDKIGEGFYKILMTPFFEYYLIKAYKIFGGRRCIRIRFGWKIKDNLEETAPFVFAINPWRTYSGV